MARLARRPILAALAQVDAGPASTYVQRALRRWFITLDALDGRDCADRAVDDPSYARHDVLRDRVRTGVLEAAKLLKVRVRSNVYFPRLLAFVSLQLVARMRPSHAWYRWSQRDEITAAATLWLNDAELAVAHGNWSTASVRAWRARMLQAGWQLDKYHPKD